MFKISYLLFLSVTISLSILLISDSFAQTCTSEMQKQCHNNREALWNTSNANCEITNFDYFDKELCKEIQRCKYYSNYPSAWEACNRCGDPQAAALAAENACLNKCSQARRNKCHDVRETLWGNANYLCEQYYTDSFDIELCKERQRCKYYSIYPCAWEACNKCDDPEIAAFNLTDICIAKCSEAKRNKCHDIRKTLWGNADNACEQNYTNQFNIELCKEIQKCKYDSNHPSAWHACNRCGDPETATVETAAMEVENVCSNQCLSALRSKCHDFRKTLWDNANNACEQNYTNQSDIDLCKKIEKCKYDSNSPSAWHACNKCEDPETAASEVEGICIDKYNPTSASKSSSLTPSSSSSFKSSSSLKSSSMSSLQSSSSIITQSSSSIKVSSSLVSSSSSESLMSCGWSRNTFDACITSCDNGAIDCINNNYTSDAYCLCVKSKCEDTCNKCSTSVNYTTCSVYLTISSSKQSSSRSSSSIISSSKQSSSVCLPKKCWDGSTVNCNESCLVNCESICNDICSSGGLTPSETVGARGCSCNCEPSSSTDQINSSFTITFSSVSSNFSTKSSGSTVVVSSLGNSSADHSQNVSSKINQSSASSDGRIAICDNGRCNVVSSAPGVYCTTINCYSVNPEIDCDDMGCQFISNSSIGNFSSSTSINISGGIKSISSSSSVSSSSFIKSSLSSKGASSLNSSLSSQNTQFSDPNKRGDCIKATKVTGTRYANNSNTLSGNSPCLNQYSILDSKIWLQGKGDWVTANTFKIGTECRVEDVNANRYLADYSGMITNSAQSVLCMLSEGKTGDAIYIDESCNIIPSNQTDSICADYYTINAYFLSPISLIWENNAELKSSVTNFQLDPKSKNEWYHWKGSAATPLIVYDPKKTGKITSPEQLFGSYTFGKNWRDGFAALEFLDTNQDGKLSDAELRDLSLWFDKNQNGISEKGEVIDIRKAGVLELYYARDDDSATTVDIWASKGFSRKLLDGTIVTGASVDWFTEVYNSKESAEKALIYEGKSSIATTNTDTKQSFNGIWKWEVDASFKSEDDLNNSGYFILDEKNNDLFGYSIIEFVLEENPSKVRSVVLTLPTKGAKTLTPSGSPKAKFTLEDKRTGMTTNNAAEITSDGKKMIGVSRTETINSMTGEKGMMHYAWTAVKLDI